MRKDYMPFWYIEKIEKKEIRYYQSLTIVLIMSVFILSGFALRAINSYNDLVFEGSKKSVVEGKEKEFLELKTLNEVHNKIINSSLKLDKVSIHEDTISMVINVENFQEYLSNIKYLETNSEIIFISTVMGKENEKFFEVKVKMKNG
ncbi:hypothetical protein SDC9_113676 [bioreactor metagenome]|uniref:Uncharacterized protein n=1 Tax=bioreactor metagenome TaxID=1076179 RepID=A0A645BND4_9ZZZZ